tara:strand:+ start:126 stop:1775 length:1650 start_codon:yes stop_codon:yes gene_type:complete
MSKLKIGFIVDNSEFDPYSLSLFQEIDADPIHFAPPAILSQTINESNPKNFLFAIKFLFSINAFSLPQKMIKRIALFLLSLVESEPLNEKRFSARDLNQEIHDLKPAISKSGFVYRYELEEIQKIQDLKLDLLIRCGSGILRGDILTCTPMGVLSFHHGDNRFYRGGPPGFWEVFLEQPSTGFIVQQLTETLDAGNIIARGNFMTAHNWESNYTFLRKKSNFFLLKLLKNISITKKLPLFEKDVLYLKEIFKAPSGLQLIHYLLKIYAPIKNSYFSYKRVMRWSVSFSPNAGLDLQFSKGVTITNPSGRFLADPFVIKHENKNICFVEDYCYRENKGKISAFELNQDSYQSLGIVLEEDFHLSFPFVFKADNELFMIPESSQNNDIRLYRAKNFPYKWELVNIIMKNISAADTMVCELEGTWFLFTNICSAGMNDHQSELHIFYSDDLREGAWNAVKCNPVIFDSNKARNAGLFFINNKLYRVNQVHGQNHYGKSFQVNEVLELNKEIYLEKTILSVKPDFLKNLTSTHHLHMNDDFTVYDHARMEKVV